MSKFKVLRTNESFMARIGIYSDDLTKPTKFLKTVEANFIVLNLVLMIIFNAVFIYENASNFPLVLSEIMVIIGCVQGLGAYVNIGLKLDKVQDLHLFIQGIVNKGGLTELPIYEVARKCTFFYSYSLTPCRKQSISNVFMLFLKSRFSIYSKRKLIFFITFFTSND